MADAGKLEARIHHVLPRQAHLQSTRVQALVDGADIEHDQVAAVIDREARGKTHGDEGFVAAVDTGQDAETVAALRPQVLQRPVHRGHLAVGKRGAFEQAEHGPLCVEALHRAISGQ